MSSTVHGILVSAVLSTLGGALGALAWASFSYFDAQTANLTTIFSFYILGAAAVNLSALCAHLLKREEGLLLGLGIWLLLLAIHAVLPVYLLITIVGLSVSLFYLRQSQVRIGWSTAGMVSILVSVTWVFTLVRFCHLPSWEHAFVRSGYLNADRVFHAAVANLLNNYGVVSNGVEGLSGIAYHIGSHWLLGMVSKPTSTTMFDSYQVGFYPLMLPMLLFGLKTVILAIAQNSQISTERVNLTKVWFGIGILLTGVLPFNVGWAHPYQWYSVFLSESYTFAVIALLIVLASLGPRLVSMLHHTGRSDDFWGVLGLTLLVGSIGLVKISIPFVLLPALGYLLLRSGRWRLTVFYLLTSITTLIVIYSTVGAGMGSAGVFNPLFPILKFKESPSVLFFQPWLFFYLLIRLGTSAIRLEEIKSKKLLDVEFFVVLTILSLVPGALIPIGGGSEIYFSEVPMWLIAPTVIVAMSKCTLSRLPALGIFLIFQLVCHGSGNILKAVGDHAKFKSCINGEAARCEEIGVWKDSPSSISDKERSGFLDSLSSLNTHENLEYGVFIPQDSRYWRMHSDTRILAFFVPAVSGLPLWGGLRHLEGKKYYGIQGQEHLFSKSPQDTSEALDQACAADFQGIFVVVSHEQIEKYLCPTEKHQSQ